MTDLEKRAREVLSKHDICTSEGEDQLVSDLLAVIPQPQEIDLVKIFEYFECHNTLRTSTKKWRQHLVKSIIVWATTVPPRPCPTCGQGFTEKRNK